MSKLFHAKESGARCKDCFSVLFVLKADVYKGGDVDPDRDFYKEYGQAPWSYSEATVCRKCGRGFLHYGMLDCYWDQPTVRGK